MRSPSLRASAILEMKDALIWAPCDPHSNIGEDVVLVCVHLEEAAAQFPVGDYLVARPTEEKKQLLFEEQTC